MSWGSSTRSITTTMPLSVGAGSIKVQTPGGTATLDFKPVLGTIEIHAETSSGFPVAGLGVVVTDAAGAGLEAVA